MTASSSLTVLIVGSGAREHALATSIQKSPRCKRLLVTPGNGGTPGERFGIAADNVVELVALCVDQKVDLAVVGPETSLAAGIADELAKAGIRCFGPNMRAAQLETSKSYAREVAALLGIPGPRYATFGAGEFASAIRWWKNLGTEVVIKQSGLAGGKGVFVPQSEEETAAAIEECLALSETVIEERLHGIECSLISFCDGHASVPLPLAQDHKRIGEGDTGLNTGGMGAYAPINVGLGLSELNAQFVQPVIAHLESSHIPYMGMLYAGLMITKDGPRLLEFNCRFGDPETQVLLPLLDSDLLDIMMSCVDGKLQASDVKVRTLHALGVVVACDTYPAASSRGAPILSAANSTSSAPVFHGGTDVLDNRLVTNGGRIFTCVGVGESLSEARTLAYQNAAAVQFSGAYFRRDIGWRSIGASITSYSATGVDIDEGTRAVNLMKASIETTTTAQVLRGVGAFGGALDVSFLKEFDEPVLVASTDGVGTKVELAARTGRVRGTGIDIVNHCINDVLVQRATPLFFLDYLASSHVDAERVAAVVDGMSYACAAAGCVLLGGETAEMPGVYVDGAFDIAGTLVGVAERRNLLPRSDIARGDMLIGVASNGPHTNGYSLLRKVFEWIPLEATPHPLKRNLADTLLEPHRNYLPVLAKALDTECVKALVHITGGGLPDNIPRVLPAGVDAEVVLGSWPMPPLFQLVRQLTTMEDVELYRTLNMGIGMVIIVHPSDAAKVRDAIDEPTWIIGNLTSGTQRVNLR
ncbi:MAG: phosphoribosylamine--glycine ligase [Ilumatobacteraceae bacterium]